MLNPSVLDSFRLRVAERALGVYGVHLYVEGQGEIEHRYRADDRVHLWSASKTFAALAVGMCVAEGRFALTDTVLGLFPECAPTAAPGSEAITLRNLLQMTSGKEHAGMFHELDEEVVDTTDWAELFFAGEVRTTPGSRFFYSSADTYMLGRAVEQVSGQVLRDYLMPRLFGPLGIRNPSWNTCPRGHSIGGFGLQLRTSELARLGRLLLQEGRWDDQELVPAAYVQAMHTDVVPTGRHFPDDESDCGYGYQVWRNTVPGTYRADGMYGQFSIVLPEQRAVVTTTSHNEHNANDIIRAVFSDIMPRL